MIRPAPELRDQIRASEAAKFGSIRGRHPDMSRRGGARVRAATKIAFDRLGSAMALLWLWPILAGIAVGIRLTMGSPVLFRQVRAGAACRHHRRSRHITPQPGTFAGEVYLLNTFGHIRHQMLKHAFLIV